MRGERETDKAREGLVRRLRRQYDRATLQCVRAELMGRRQIVLQGCREILKYERECIVLAVRDPDVSTVCIGGAELLCLSYHADAVVIQGEIDTVTLCRRDVWDGDKEQRRQG